MIFDQNVKVSHVSYKLTGFTALLGYELQDYCLLRYQNVSYKHTISTALSECEL